MKRPAESWQNIGLSIEAWILILNLQGKMFYGQDMTPWHPCLANPIRCISTYLSVHHPAL